MTLANEDHTRLIATPRIIVGFAIALFGVVLVLDRMNLVIAGQVLRFWPAVIVAVGALIYTQSRRIGGGVNGIVVMAVGGWLLLNSLGIVRIGFWEMFWPMILILIGTMLIVQTVRNRGDGTSANSDDTLTIFAVLSGIKRSSAAARFRGGELTMFMGGGQIDLRQATIPRGQEAVIDIFAVMGGCEIIVPPDWVIATPLVPVMGGVEDKRLAPLPGSIGTASDAPRLVLRGFVMMGGIQLKN